MSLMQQQLATQRNVSMSRANVQVSSHHQLNIDALFAVDSQKVHNTLPQTFVSALSPIQYLVISHEHKSG